AFLPGFVLDQVGRLARRDYHQQLPQIIPVRQACKPSLFRSAAETIERAEGDVLLVGCLTVDPVEPLAGQSDQAWKVILPELLNRLPVARPESLQPDRHGSRFRHAQPQVASQDDQTFLTLDGSVGSHKGSCKP